MGFANIAAVQAAYAANKGQFLPYYKVQAGNNVAGVLHSLFKATGFPGAGSTGTKGKANGRVCVGTQNASPTAGAFAYMNASSGESMNLAGLSTYASGAAWGGTVILADRVADCNVDASESSGSFTGLTATSRLESTSGFGDGCQIALSVTTAFSAATTTFNLTYTNELGVSGQVTPNFTTVASSIVDRSPTVAGSIFLPLQAGDKGVRSIESITLVTNNSATGAFDICLVRELARVELPAVTSQYLEHDTMANLLLPVTVFDDSCLQLFVVANSANTYSIGGEIKLVSG